MRRRDVLAGAGSAVATRWLAGCDRLVVLGGDDFTLIDPITSNADHYVFSAFGTPDLDPAALLTSVRHGDVDLAVFDRAYVEALSARDKEHTLQCIGSGPRNFAVSNAVWSGLPLTEVLAALGVAVPSTAVGLRLVGADRNDYTGIQYSAGLPIDVLQAAPIWLVWRMNGERLSLDHGAPYRLLIPGRYGMKNVKWPVEIAFVDTPHVSFWTPYGWDEAAEYLPNALIIQPDDQVELAAGERVRFAGAAYAGTDAVIRVDVSLDGGPFEEATLDYAPGADIWVLWSWQWTVSRGTHTLQARCVTASGAQSDPNPDGTDLWSGYDGSMQITVISA